MKLFSKNFSNFFSNDGSQINKTFIKKKKKIIRNSLKNSLKQSENKKNLIFIIYENNLEFYLFYLEILFSKNVIHIINSNINQENLDNLVNKFSPNMIIFNKKKNFNYEKNYFNNFNSEFFKVNYQKKFTNHKINPNLAALISTSATTGSSKLVRLSYENIYHNTRSIIKYLKISHRDRLITTLPVDYTFGFSQINTHLCSNAKIILNNFSVIQKQFWDLLTKSKATTFGGVPFTFEILDKIKFYNNNLTFLKSITQAGGKLDENIQKKFALLLKKKNIKFYIMYGATEATSRMSYLPAKYAHKKIGSIGKAIPGGKFKLKKLNKTENKGELIYYGKNVCMGYCENIKDLQKPNLNKGKLYTGDIGYIDNEGFFYISGRMKRFIKILGHRINLDELEKKIKSDLKLKNIVCTGNDNMLHLNILKKNKNKIVNLKNYLNRNLKLNSNLFKISTINKIPRNLSGKVIYKKIKND